MQGITAYQQNAVTTQPKGRIIVMLYEGAVKFLRQAADAINARDYVAKGRLINRAIDILLELNVSLDMEQGGEIAGNLRSLYDFMLQELAVANTRCDRRRIETVIGLLEELNEGWKAISA